MKLLMMLSLLFLYSCGGGGTTTGNPVRQVNVSMQDKQPFAWMKKFSEFFVHEAHAAASTSIEFCFKRLRFKPDSSTSGSNYDLTIGKVSINPSGTNLFTISVPEGTYRRIEFDLENNCDGSGAPSVSFDNGAPRSTTDTMTIKFEGTYVVDADGTLNLDIDPLIDNMDLVANDADIKLAMESATGAY